MSALSRAHVLVLVDTVTEEFDAAICYGAAQEQEAVLVPNTDPHRRSLTHMQTFAAPSRSPTSAVRSSPHYVSFCHLTCGLECRDVVISVQLLSG